MPATSKISKIKKFLKDNGFYKYRTQIKKISENYRLEFLREADPKNKRNIIIEKSWHDIVSFGRKRKLLVLELGGSYFKLFDVTVTHKDHLLVNKFQSIRFYEDKLYTPQILFEDMKVQLDAFVKKKDRKNIDDCVFIFTFPIEQYARKDGVIDAVTININKAVRSKNIIGIKIGESLQKYLRRRGYPKIKIGVTNDSMVNVLSAKGIEIGQKLHFDAALNIIVGTGSNIAVGYNIPEGKKSHLYMVNTEFGGFHTTPTSTFDQIFHKNIASGSEYLNEKMISGIWQPFVFKIILEECVKNKILQPTCLDIFKRIPLDGGEIETALNSRKNHQYSEIHSFIWNELIQRGATLCGIGIASVMAEIGRQNKGKSLKFALIEVGSVLKKAKNFKEIMTKTIDKELIRLKAAKNVKYVSTRPRNATPLGATVFSTITCKKK
ncbi:hypothetical protein GF340_02610 [Candidatus Peregrinibacteria bacterium]|nr:hypothetical protein [Candidatus Peregrinibacteria bacterium]